jgi:rhomboid family GlyGly-CTERM serine protease
MPQSDGHDNKAALPVVRGTKLGPGHWVMGLAAAVMVLLWAGGDDFNAWLRYQRSAILHGEVWRLVTGHIVHVNFRHMALNVAGGAVMAALFSRTFALRHWLVIAAASLFVIDAGFLLRDRTLESYVGFSGILHGILAAGMLAWWRTESGLLAFALTVITVGKLAWEQWEGPVTLAGDDFTVIVNAHLYGAIGGGIVGAILLARNAIPRRSSPTKDTTVE